MAYDWSTYVSPGHRFVTTSVRIAEQLSKEADRFLAAYDLTLAQFNILAVLMQHPKGITQTAIGDSLVVSRANITGLVRRLKSRGLCKTTGRSNDARVKIVRILPPGRTMMNRLRKPYFKEIERLTKGLSKPSMNKACDLMDQMQAHWSEA